MFKKKELLKIFTKNRMDIERSQNSLKFVFISTCYEYWGGSEELWSESARYLKSQGFAVSSFKNRVRKDNRTNRLKADGIPVNEIYILVVFLRIFNSLLEKEIYILNVFLHISISLLEIALIFFVNLKTSNLFAKEQNLTLFMISQGENFDGAEVAKVCIRFGLPYVIVCQKATDSVLVHGRKRQMMQDMYRQAQASFFVSQHNLLLTQAQIGYELTNAEVIRNPYRVNIPVPLTYPKIENNCYKIACVGRLFVFDKGQDVLLSVLAQEKWKNRDLHISFFGNGVDREALVDMANFFEVKNVSFPGFAENIDDIWSDHHALIMPSRGEGLAIALVEAMMCGRMGIVTDVGGVLEVVEDDITGFIASGVSFQEIDKALERAWQRRYEWEPIGKEAFRSIRQIIPPYPERIFADKLVQLCQADKPIQA